MTQTTDLQDITAALIVVACLRIFLRHMEARAAFYLSHLMYPHNMGQISEQCRVLLLIDQYSLFFYFLRMPKSKHNLNYIVVINFLSTARRKIYSQIYDLRQLCVRNFISPYKNKHAKVMNDEIKFLFIKKLIL